MPVSKNKRKNHTAVKARADKKIRREKRENEALKILAMGLKEFYKTREGISKMARMYVDITKSIPNYQETDPAVGDGLRAGIPILKEINLRYDALVARVAELYKNPPKSQLDMVEEVQELESLYYELGHNFLDHFLPVISAVENLASAKGFDKKAVEEARVAVNALKPKFETVTQ